MAGAKPGVYVLNLQPDTVPSSLVSGEKVYKWDEVRGHFLCYNGASGG